MDCRPTWCPYVFDCKAIKSLGDQICIGELPDPLRHNDGFNTHRFCLTGIPGKREQLLSLRINGVDAWGMADILQAPFDFNEVLKETASGRKTSSYKNRNL